MDKIEKALAKLTQKERQSLKEIILRIKDSHLENLDLKRLKGKDNIFRVRKGNTRIIFSKQGKTIKILAAERRSSHTYR